MTPKNIFIVDDDPMIIEFIKDRLEKTNHNISAFSTGEECIRHIDESTDIVILDYYLNSIHRDAVDGKQVLQFIKFKYPKIRVIMLSSREQQGFAKETVDLGAEKYVLKDKDALNQIADLVNAS